MANREAQREKALHDCMAILHKQARPSSISSTSSEVLDISSSLSAPSFRVKPLSSYIASTTKSTSVNNVLKNTPGYSSSNATRTTTGKTRTPDLSTSTSSYESYTSSISKPNAASSPAGKDPRHRRNNCRAKSTKNSGDKGKINHTASTSSSYTDKSTSESIQDVEEVSTFNTMSAPRTCSDTSETSTGTLCSEKSNPRPSEQHIKSIGTSSHSSSTSRTSGSFETVSGESYLTISDSKQTGSNAVGQGQKSPEPTPVKASKGLISIPDTLLNERHDSKNGPSVKSKGVLKKTDVSTQTLSDCSSIESEYETDSQISEPPKTSDIREQSSLEKRNKEIDGAIIKSPVDEDDTYADESFLSANPSSGSEPTKKEADAAEASKGANETKISPVPTVSSESTSSSGSESHKETLRFLESLDSEIKSIQESLVVEMKEKEPPSTPQCDLNKAEASKEVNETKISPVPTESSESTSSSGSESHKETLKFLESLDSEIKSMQESLLTNTSTLSPHMVSFAYDFVYKEEISEKEQVRKKPDADLEPPQIACDDVGDKGSTNKPKLGASSNNPIIDIAGSSIEMAVPEIKETKIELLSANSLKDADLGDEEKSKNLTSEPIMDKSGTVVCLNEGSTKSSSQVEKKSESCSEKSKLYSNASIHKRPANSPTSSKEEDSTTLNKQNIVISIIDGKVEKLISSSSATVSEKIFVDKVNPNTSESTKSVKCINDSYKSKSQASLKIVGLKKRKNKVATTNSSNSDKITSSVNSEGKSIDPSLPANRPAQDISGTTLILDPKAVASTSEAQASYFDKLKVELSNPEKRCGVPARDSAKTRGESSTTWQDTDVPASYSNKTKAELSSPGKYTVGPASDSHKAKTVSLETGKLTAVPGSDFNQRKAESTGKQTHAPASDSNKTKAALSSSEKHTTVPAKVESPNTDKRSDVPASNFDKNKAASSETTMLSTVASNMEELEKRYQVDILCPKPEQVNAVPQPRSDPSARKSPQVKSELSTRVSSLNTMTIIKMLAPSGIGLRMPKPGKTPERPTDDVDKMCLTSTSELKISKPEKINLMCTSKSGNPISTSATVFRARSYPDTDGIPTKPADALFIPRQLPTKPSAPRLHTLDDVDEVSEEVLPVQRTKVPGIKDSTSLLPEIMESLDRVEEMLKSRATLFSKKHSIKESSSNAAYKTVDRSSNPYVNQIQDQTDFKPSRSISIPQIPYQIHTEYLNQILASSLRIHDAAILAGREMSAYEGRVHGKYKRKQKEKSSKHCEHQEHVVDVQQREDQIRRLERARLGYEWERLERDRDRLERDRVRLERREQHFERSRVRGWLGDTGESVQGTEHGQKNSQQRRNREKIRVGRQRLNWDSNRFEVNEEGLRKRAAELSSNPSNPTESSTCYTISSHGAENSYTKKSK